MFNTSALCKMYDMTDSTKKTMMEVLSFLKDRIWIPGHVWVEYERNREKVIRNPITEKYGMPRCFDTSTLKTGREFLQKLKSSEYYHPYISSELHVALTEDLEKALRLVAHISDEIKKEFNTRINEINALVDNDIIRDTVQTIQRGNEFSFNEMMTIAREGTVRYQSTIPPGYMDRDGKKGLRIYGDLFVWKQIIDYAKENEKDVLFILNDEKEDWWENFKKNELREELLMEFQELTDQRIEAMPLERFISLLEDEYKEDGKLQFVDGLEAVKDALDYANTALPFDERCVMVKCSECGNIQTELMSSFVWDWDECGWSEEEMGTNREYDCCESLECSKCGAEMELKFQMNEYPAGVLECIEVESEGCTIENDPEFEKMAPLPFRTDDLGTCLVCGRREHSLQYDMCQECLDEFNYKVEHD